MNKMGLWNTMPRLGHKMLHVADVVWEVLTQEMYRWNMNIVTGTDWKLQARLKSQEQGQYLQNILSEFFFFFFQNFLY